MGTFNVSCAVSKATIGNNDRIVAFIVKRTNKISSKFSKFANDDRKEKEWPHKPYGNPYHFHTPLTLPIYCRYDWYGGINIDTSKTNPLTLKIIKEKFGLADEEFITKLAQDEANDMAVVYVLESVYEYLSHSTHIHESNRSNSFLNVGDVDAKFLIGLGFKSTDIHATQVYMIADETKYGIQFRDSVYPELVYIDHQIEQIDEYVSNPVYFFDAWNKHSSIKLNPTEEMNRPVEYSQWANFLDLDSYKQHMCNPYMLMKSTHLLSEWLSSDRDSMLQKMNSILGIQFHDTYVIENMATLFYGEQFFDISPDELIQFARFAKSLYLLNRHLSPSYNGCQYGNRKVELEYHTKMVQILSEMLSDNNE